ncbi:MAG: 50S ribosomal protein L11 methyltransferase [Gallionella sp.]|nr:50S ribosomal protein L11 methyltransferase [Gallionella sp.]
MAWLTLIADTDAAHAEALSDALLEHGALSVDLLDADADTPDEQAIFGEPGEPPPGVWQHNRVSALFDAGSDVENILKQAASAAGLSQLPKHSITTLDDQDWVRLTQSQFDPIPISDRLWIVPTWHTPSDPQAINIVLDPGLAFGTGSHPTTRLCLRWLDNHVQGGESVLDYGCGSGILAIAAKKLGAGETLGVDIDPQAIIASQQNAEQNDVAARFFLPDALPPQAADIVVANILSIPLKMLAPLLAQSCRSGGRIALSGILAEQADEVASVYAQWFDMAPPVFLENWTLLSGAKR